MKEVDRRSVVGALVTAGATVGAAELAQALPPELPLRDLQLKAQSGCLYHCDFGDHARFSQQLRNINNHFAAYNYDQKALKLVIVAHSVGIKFFLKDLADTPFAQETIDPELLARTVSLTKHGREV